MRTFTPKNMRLPPPEAKRVFAGVIFDTYQWQQKMFDGSFSTFEMLKRPDTVEVIALKGDRIIVLEQEQPTLGSFRSLPGGRSDIEGEDELQAAKRETLEETGMRFERWKLLRAVQPHSKIDWVVYTFCADGFLGQDAQALDAGEKITITEWTFEEVKHNVEDPKFYIPRDIFRKARSLEELKALPPLPAA